MPKKIAIIGAGIAGLCAAAYARMNGYAVDIFESHTQTGGLCTAWRRNGFTFDGCIHWVGGSGPGNPFYSLWNEVGVLEGRTFLYPTAYTTTRGADGRTLVLYADPERLEKHLLELSPADAVPSREFCDLVRAFLHATPRVDKARELLSPLDQIRTLVAMWPVRRAWRVCTRTSIGGFASRFHDPLLRMGLYTLFDPRASLFIPVATLASLARQSAGYPIGGSLPFAKALEQRCEALGARIHTGTRVSRVVVEDGLARGVVLEDGRVVPADIVISAADLRKSLQRLLEGRFPSPQHEYLFDHVDCHLPCVQVSFGLSREFEECEDAISHRLVLPRPARVPGGELDVLAWSNYRRDPTMAPPGKSVIIVHALVEPAFWNQLALDRPKYELAKADFANATRTAMDGAHSGFSDAVEVVDVATPITTERYTGSHEGRFMTWLAPTDYRATRNIPRTVPGLKNFYLTGMWVSSLGGLPSAIKSSRDLIQVLCRKDHLEFRTTAPLPNQSGSLPRVA